MKRTEATPFNSSEGGREGVGGKGEGRREEGGREGGREEGGRGRGWEEGEGGGGREGGREREGREGGRERAVFSPGHLGISGRLIFL